MTGSNFVKQGRDAVATIVGADIAIKKAMVQSAADSASSKIGRLHDQFFRDLLGNALSKVASRGEDDQ